MANFVEFETNKGMMTFNVDEIEFIQSANSGTEATIQLKSGLSFAVLEPYETVSGFTQWVADGRSEHEHDEECPDCGGPLEEMPEEEKEDKSN